MRANKGRVTLTHEKFYHPPLSQMTALWVLSVILSTCIVLLVGVPTFRPIMKVIKYAFLVYQLRNFLRLVYPLVVYTCARYPYAAVGTACLLFPDAWLVILGCGTRLSVHVRTAINATATG